MKPHRVLRMDRWITMVAEAAASKTEMIVGQTRRRREEGARLALFLAASDRRLLC